MTSWETNDDNLLSPHAGVLPKCDNYTIHQRIKAFLFKPQKNASCFALAMSCRKKDKEISTRVQVVSFVLRPSVRVHDSSDNEASITKLGTAATAI